jgi:hypothetical protein
MRAMNASERGAPDHLARKLLPVLLHKLANATQLLTGLNAMLSIEGGEELFSERSEDLSRCSRDVSELGWALAVVGSGNGAELLLARRDPQGLRILLGLVSDASRRANGARLTLPDDLPTLTPGALDGWQLPWAIASLLLAAGEQSDRKRLEWTLAPSSPEGWRLTVDGGDGLRARGMEIVQQLPGAEWSWLSDQGRLDLPGPWLKPAPAR